MRIIMHAILFFHPGRSPVSMCRMKAASIIIFGLTYIIDILDSILLKGICFRDDGIQMSKPVYFWTHFGDVLVNICLMSSRPSTLRSFDFAQDRLLLRTGRLPSSPKATPDKQDRRVWIRWRFGGRVPIES